MTQPFPIVEMERAFPGSLKRLSGINKSAIRNNAVSPQGMKKIANANNGLGGKTKAGLIVIYPLPRSSAFFHHLSPFNCSNSPKHIKVVFSPLCSANLHLDILRAPGACGRRDR